ncbi:MAG TPA: hypothetical protein VKV20_14050 [Ktedonobacteraceae bacterium]|jgi:hypothetical protein|nr:hypothetical protein [Ktedonobacteraceae bacterium]
MLTLIIIVVLFIVFDYMAWRWGVDTTDGVTSCEWDRRWRSFE